MVASTNAGVSSEELATRLAQCLAGFDDITAAYLFGSHGRGAARARSDVDVAVLVDEVDRAEGRTRYGLEAELATAIMDALGRSDVDVVVLNRASPVLAHRAIRDGRLLSCKDERARVRGEAAIMQRYLGTAHLRERKYRSPGRQLPPGPGP